LLSQQAPIIQLFGQILSAKKHDPEADTTALEREIDRLVYELYELTPGEIALVEGSNPFTPRSGQEPKVFIGREKELATFTKHLENMKVKRYDHFVVVGGWGTGKTTLLKEFRKIAHAQPSRQWLRNIGSIRLMTS
jgi:ATPase subunit of ABC transporter with duplicated ATPase domains